MREQKNYKVFCVGLNKTGTTTMGRAFKSLKIRTVGFEAELVRTVLRGKYALLENRLEHHDGFQDFPFPLIYQRMFSRYGDQARFVLSARKSPEIWLQSLKRHSLRNGGKSFRRKIYGYEFPHLNEQAHLDYYNRHNDRFLEFAEKNNCKYAVTVMGEDNLYEKKSPLLNEKPPTKEIKKANALGLPDDLTDTRFVKFLSEMNRQLEAAGKRTLSAEEALDV